MRAYVVRSNRLACTQKRIPALRSGWAIVRVRLAGICNTDLEILRGYHGFRGTLGHEFVGEVAETRELALRERSRWLGRRVVGEINIACRALGYAKACDFCRRGLRTHCERRRVLGIVAHDGAFAEYLTLPLENLHRVPPGMGDEQAVFVEPLAAACEILTQVDVSQFHSAAVLGDGKLGQLVARVLRFAGSRVTLFGKHKSKLALARRAGIATVQVAGTTNFWKRRQDGFSLVVEATGSSAGLAIAQQITAPRGTLILKSTFHGAAAVETWPIVVKELNVVGSRCGPFERALSLLRSGRVDPTPLIAGTFPLSELSAAVEFARRSGVLKVLLRP